VALPPTIPTSFVPKQPVAPTLRRQKSGTNIFFLLGAGALGLAIVASLATFGYEFYLKSARDTKEAELVTAQQQVDIDAVEGFIRLRDRLNAVEIILDRHVALSEFFNTLEVRTLQTVRFSNLGLTVDADRSAGIEMNGIARSFNALAAQSAAIAAEKRIKRAIFTDIQVNENGTVGFTLTAVLDPRLITSGDVLPGIPDSTVVVPESASPIQVSEPTTATTTPRTATTTTP